MQKLQNLPGMRDLLPADTALWQRVEDTVRRLVQNYGYQEIRTPLMEKTELFKRSVGDVTDIVEKEMYTLEDSEGTSLALRPEGTASCVRACMQYGMLRNQATQRLWYSGPMFRHERQQKGRYRQFSQIGIETFGLTGPDIDAELIIMTARLWRELGIENVRLEINSLGTAESRAQHKEALLAYLNEHYDVLDEDSRRRLERNPLRILDTKNPDMQAMVTAAPQLLDYLDDESREHFEAVQALLSSVGIEYVVNPRLVRGLDYYSRTVFEWITNDLGAQGTICAGGRYDGLVGHLGGTPTPAFGAAMGVDRLVLLLEAQQSDANVSVVGPDVYLVAVGDEPQRHALAIAEQLRDAVPNLSLQVNGGGGSFKAQMKRANRYNAKYALIVGDQELASGLFALKPLQTDDEQLALSLDDIAAKLQ